MQDLGGPVGQPGPSAGPVGRFPGHVSKPSNSDTGFSHGAFTSNVTGFADRHPRRGHVPAINTVPMGAQPPHHPPNAADMTTPGTAFDMQFTPLLPSQLLLGSPFQPGTPATFASSQFPSQLNFQQAQQAAHQQTGVSSPVQQNMSPQA